MRDHRSPAEQTRCRVAVIWIDWYPYHVARFRGLESEPTLAGHVAGIELVSGVGVHSGLRFREALPQGAPITTLMPDCSWHDANKLTLTRMLWQQLSRLDPEVVLVPGYYTLPAMAAAAWARLHGRTPVLMTESGAADHARTPWKESCKGAGLKVLFDWTIAGGKAHMDYLRQLGFPDERVVPSYDVVDNDFFRRGTQRLRENRMNRVAGDPADERPFFLYVGRLAEEKNVMSLLRSWLRYRESGGSWPLVIVGDGPEAEPLKCTAASSPFAEDVFFPGLKSSLELLPFYAFAGCFVLPSTREPWGLVVNEAMAAGLPVIASARCGCAADLVRVGDNGFVFDPDSESADAVLARLLRHIEEAPAGERERMGLRSQDIIRSFSPAHFGRSIASIVRANDRHGVLHPAEGGAR